MTAADRAVSILRAGLCKPHSGIERAEQPRWENTKNDFMRHLDEQPFPADPPPSLVTPNPTRAHFSKHYGRWLYKNNPPEFSRLYRAWKEKQISNTSGEPRA